MTPLRQRMIEDLQLRGLYRWIVRVLDFLEQLAVIAEPTRDALVLPIEDQRLNDSNR